jgi:hypothetical protein
MLKIAFENKLSGFHPIGCGNIKIVSSMLYVSLFLEDHLFFLVHYKQIFQIHEIQYVSNRR